MVPLTEEQRELAAKWFGLAIKYSRQWERPPLWRRDDCESLAAEALCVAARMFDESKGIPFPNFLGICVRHRMIDWKRRGRKRVNLFQALRPVGCDGIEPTPDSLVDERDDHSHIDGSDEVAAYYRAITPRERTCLDMVMDGHTHQEIGEKVGLSRGHVMKVLREARQVLAPIVEQRHAG